MSFVKFIIIYLSGFQPFFVCPFSQGCISFRPVLLHIVLSGQSLLQIPFPFVLSILDMCFESPVCKRGEAPICNSTGWSVTETCDCI